MESRGCDADPVDPTTEDGGLTLLSYVWPDQAGRHRLLRAALEVARRIPAKVETADLVDWAGRNAHPVAGAATVVYHSIVMQYLTEGDRESFEDLLLERGRATTSRAPLVWLEMEPGGEQAEVRPNAAARGPGANRRHNQIPRPERPLALFVEWQLMRDYRDSAATRRRFLCHLPPRR